MEVIWISVRKISVFFIGILMLLGLSTASHYYNDAGVLSEDTGFAVPEYDSHEEILIELVAPFIFLTLILHFVLVKVLHFTLRDDDYAPSNPYVKSEKPSVSKYSMMMSIAITAALIPTVFWQYVVWSIRLLGVASIVFFAGIAIFVMYLMARR